MNDILGIFIWYLLTTVIGVAVFPIAFRLFSGLPQKGFAFAKPLGLLLWGYIFWLLGSLGVLQNDLGGQITAFLILLAIGLLVIKGDKKAELFAWVREKKNTLLVMEGLSLLFFVGWAVIRGMNPEVAYTEKPMELAFIQSLLRSPEFPPMDPWLSGYAISYYYFGYVMIAMITRITGVTAAVGFNLASALWFSLTAVAVYGIVYDLVSLWTKKKGTQDERFSRRASLLGPLFLLIVSTLEGVLEFLYSGGVFWKMNENGELASPFWKWLGILDLNQPPPLPLDWIPSRASGWLWWRGSRVIQDLTLSGANVEVIDEFPFFSYLLSDLHPHLLAMPFVLMAVGLSLNLFTGARTYLQEQRSLKKIFTNWTFWASALILGSLGFINTWDFPIYVGLFCLVWSYRQYQEEGFQIRIAAEFVLNGLLLGVAGVLLYLPFYLGFASQAGGILPSLEFMTRGVHFWVLFGSLLVPVLAFSIYTFKRTSNRVTTKLALRILIIVCAVLFILSLLMGAILLSLTDLGTSLAASPNGTISSLGVRLEQAGNAFTAVHGGFAANEILSQTLLRRLKMPGTWLTLGFLIFLNLSILLRRDKTCQVSSNEDSQSLSGKRSLSVENFIIVLILIGALLTLFPEFFYLRDQFGTRMNTIFKFYFQAWILWSIAAAAGTLILIKELRGWRLHLFNFVWVLTLLAGLTYPAVMLAEKTNSFSMKDWTLDGDAFFSQYYPDEYSAIQWLQQAPLGVVTEAIGGSYTDYARVSTRSGQPTVLGWPGHESQWRGGGDEMGSRMGDIQLLYETKDWDTAAGILQRYNVKYIYIGNLERSTYLVTTEKFANRLPVAYQNSSVIIYAVPAEVGTPTP